MNKLLTRVAEVDPDFAKSLRRNQILSYAFAFVAILAIAGAAWAVGVNFNQSSDITRVQHSACQVDAAGQECQQTKREAARAANLVTTCIPFWKAGYPCPKPGSTAAQRQVRRQAQAGSGSAERLDSEPAPESSGTTGGVKPPTVGSHKAPAPGKGGNMGGEFHATGDEVRSEPIHEPSTEASTISPSPEEGAGNSGETPAAQNAAGVKACVEVAVSACADVGLPKPPLP
jgi:hypothetical protein